MSPVATPLIDDVAVDARQIQRRDRRRELQQHDRRELFLVRPQVRLQQRHNIYVSSSSRRANAVEQQRHDLVRRSAAARSCAGGVPANASRAKQARGLDPARSGSRRETARTTLASSGRSRASSSGRSGDRRLASPGRALEIAARSARRGAARSPTAAISWSRSASERSIARVRARSAPDRTRDRSRHRSATSLSGNTRNSVPSATPGGERDLRRRDPRPWRRSSGNVAAMMLARRCSGGRGAAREPCALIVTE